MNRPEDDGSRMVELPSTLAQHVGSFLPDADIQALWKTRKGNEPVPAHLLGPTARALLLAREAVNREAAELKGKRDGLHDGGQINGVEKPWVEAWRREKKLVHALSRWEGVSNGVGAPSDLSLHLARLVEDLARPEQFQIDISETQQLRRNCENLMRLGQYPAVRELSGLVLAKMNPDHLEFVEFQCLYGEASLQQDAHGAADAVIFLIDAIRIAAKRSDRSQYPLEPVLARALLRLGHPNEALGALTRENRQAWAAEIMALHSCGRLEEATRAFDSVLAGSAHYEVSEKYENWFRPATFEREVNQFRSIVLCNPPMLEIAAWLNMDESLFEATLNRFDAGQSWRMSNVHAFSYFFKPVHDSPFWPFLVQSLRLTRQDLFPLAVPDLTRGVRGARP